MKISISQNDKLVTIIHVIFILVCLLILALPADIKIGIKLFVLVLTYNLMIPISYLLKKNKIILNIWLFSFITSLFQIWPDWFLSAQLKVLVFPEDGFLKIGTISAYMAGLWAIPFFIIIYIGERNLDRYASKKTYIIVAILSLLIFGMAEETMWILGSWYAQNVVLLDHTAIYIIIPEIIMGIFIFYIYQIIKERHQLLKVPASFMVMIIYLGSSSFFYFLFEGLIFKLIGF